MMTITYEQITALPQVERSYEYLSRRYFVLHGLDRRFEGDKNARIYALGVHLFIGRGDGEFSLMFTDSLRLFEAEIQKRTERVEEYVNGGRVWTVYKVS